MEKGAKLYLKLFLTTLYLSAFTFGGGYVIVSLMRKKFVNEYGWLTEDEMVDLTAIAQASPGAIAVNTSLLIGYRIAGFPGAFVTILGTVIPPLVILSIVSVFYAAFRDNHVINLILKGMSAGVGAVIVDVVISLSKNVIVQKCAFTIAVMIISFIGAFFFGINVAYIMLVMGTAGFLYSLYKKKKEGGKTDGAS